MVYKLLEEQSPNGSLVTSRMASMPEPTATPGLVHDRFDPMARIRTTRAPPAARSRACRGKVAVDVPTTVPRRSGGATNDDIV